MSEDHNEPPQGDEDAAPDEQSGGKDPVRKWTLVTLAVIVLLLAWYLGADRFTPFTSQARVDAYVIPIAPQVTGNVLSVNVENNELVEKGDVLLTLDDSTYKLAVIRAESDLEQARQQLGASSAGVDSAAANIKAAEAELVRSRKDYERMQRIRAEEPGAISQRRLDLAESSLRAAESRVTSARAELERARQTRGQEGANNAQIQAALSALNQAKLQLEWTRVRAPAGGLVTDLQLEVGNLAQPGKPLMTFVGINDVWIQADMRENNLGHIQAGDPVEIALDVQPGRIVEGRVRSIGFGVDAGTSTALGSLPQISNDRNWLRDAQQFPVIIELDNPASLGLRVGAQATVMVFTENSFLLVPFGKLYMRLNAIFSYLY
ncbi:MAG: HlyD family secretion protein [Gammaproteobacteria bacterium]|nr:HlyD family secretion protein [Gammaproteobacteria bacterium]